MAGSAGMPDAAPRTPVTHDSFTIERRYRSSPAKVFQAFADPAIKRRWFAEGPGYIDGSYRLDFEVGGTETGAYKVETEGFSSEEIRSDAYYFDIVPEERIAYAYSMSNVGVPFSVSLSTVLIERGEDGGTKLTFHEAITLFAGADGARMRELGTRQLLERLAGELGEESVAVGWGKEA